MMKRVVLLTVPLLLTVVASLPAQEKFGDKRIYTVVRAETLRLDDADNHVLVLSEMKGYDVQQGNVVVNRLVTDLVKGNGRTFGYGTSTNPDGDVAYYSFEGRVTTQPRADGKLVTVSEGTWVITGGTGKWQSRVGRGSFKNTAVSQGVSVAEWEGTWEPKK